jgi:hypothetical protein
MPTVTSANKTKFDREFMEKKGQLQAAKPEDDQFERIKKHPKYVKLKAALGKKGAMDVLLKQLNDAQ